MRRALLVIIVALLALSPVVEARGGGFSSGGSRSSSGGGFSSKSSGGSKSSYGSSGSKSSSSSKPINATASKPSTGSKAQPAPVPKLIPAAPPVASVGRGSSALVYGGRPPAGRSYSRDRSYIVSHPIYANPYSGGSYYGYYNSPYFYLWLASLNNNDQRPLPPESDERVADVIESYLGVISSEAEAVTTSKENK